MVESSTAHHRTNDGPNALQKCNAITFRTEISILSVGDQVDNSVDDELKLSPREIRVKNKVRRGQTSEHANKR